MASAELLYPEIRSYVKQCPDFIIQRFLAQTVREFCFNSHYYQKTIKIPLALDKTLYPIVLEGDEVIHVDSVQIRDWPLQPVEQDLYNMTNSGYSRGYQFEPPNFLALTFTPKAEDVGVEMKVRLSLQPSETSVIVPDSILQNYKMPIVYGVISKLYLMPNEPWSNPGDAGPYGQFFWNAVNDAKAKRMSGFISKNRRVLPRKFLI